jgi:hypothetical protein
MKKIIPKTKKGQHEILGFVLIVVIVSVIGVIFLTITFGKTTQTQYDSLEISNLLESSMHYTTDCAVNFVPQYRDGQDLIKSCYNEQIGNYLNCLDGRNVCDALEETMKELIKDTLDVSEEAPNKAFKLRIYFSPLDQEDSNEEILKLDSGLFQNCSSTVGGAHIIDASLITAGTTHVELRVCKG